MFQTGAENESGSRGGAYEDSQTCRPARELRAVDNPADGCAGVSMCLCADSSSWSWHLVHRTPVLGEQRYLTHKRERITNSASIQMQTACQQHEITGMVRVSAI